MNAIHHRTVRVKSAKAKRAPKPQLPSPTAALDAVIHKVNSTDFSTMPTAARKALLADLEAHYRSREVRSPFDPSGLPELARAKYPEYPWLAAALRACTVQWKKDELYSHFIDPATHATDWKFAGTLMLDCPVRGGLAIDVLKDHRIGGIEFLDAVMGRPTSAEALQRLMRAMAPGARNRAITG